MKIIIALAGLILFWSCRQETTENELRSQVIEADRSFSKMSEEKGMAEAFIYFADENVIKPTPNKQPIYGKYALIESFKKTPPGDIVLTWEPIKAEVSGSLGYTFGSYTLRTKGINNERDTMLYGNYVSIWKKKKDGSWRYVLDTGNPTPGPAVLKR